MKMINFTKTAMKNLFSKPVTRPYPFVKREYPERTRGAVDIDINACVFCGLCSKKCPANAISVNRAGKTWSIERFGCIQCGYCVESCPKKCLSMVQEYPEPGDQKRTDTYSQPVSPAPEE